MGAKMSNLHDALRTLTGSAGGEAPDHAWFFCESDEELRATISHLSGCPDGDEMNEFIHRLKEAGDLVVDEGGGYVWHVHGHGYK
jgi:hypothetical protein